MQTAKTGAGWLAMFVVGVAAACATGCAAPATLPPTAPPPHVAPEHDTSGLTILLAPEVDASETRREVTNVLRREMQAAGYKVIAEPKGAWDVELVPRVDVWGREFVLAKNPVDAPDVHEHIKLTVTAIALHEIVASTKFEFTATNGKISSDDVNPALNALASSPKLRAFSEKVQRERDARRITVATK